MIRHLLAAMLWVGVCSGQTARDYYKELYAAGGLNSIISYRVCFDDRPDLMTFFVYTESKIIREVMISDGSFAKAPKKVQDQLKKEALIFRGYDKGVAVEDASEFHPDDGSWVSDKFALDKDTVGRIRFSITPETLRYKRAVEFLQPNGVFSPVIWTHGRCEAIPFDVKQHGK